MQEKKMLFSVNLFQHGDVSNKWYSSSSTRIECFETRSSVLK